MCLETFTSEMDAETAIGLVTDCGQMETTLIQYGGKPQIELSVTSTIHIPIWVNCH